jgi:hypothetical protein
MSSYYEIDFSDFAEKFIPWFLREYGFEFKEGDFKTGDTTDQELRFHLQARNGHYYQYIRIGVGMDRFLNADIDKQSLNKRIRKSLNEDTFTIQNIYIITLSDINDLKITDPQLLSILEQDKYVIAVDATRTGRQDGIMVTKDNTGSFLYYIKSIMGGLQYLNDMFYSYISNKKEELKYNGQIINLQKRLNDLFDNTLRRIYLANISTIPIQYLYSITEFQDDYMYSITEAQSNSFIMGSITEIGSEQYDFIVYVPVSLSYNSDQMNGIVKKYKLADKNYTIQTY